MLEEVDGCHMPEGLRHRCFCVRPIALMYFAPLTAGSMIARVGRSWFPCTTVVVEQRPEDGRGVLLGKLNAAELQLELLRHVAVGHDGHVQDARRAAPWFYVSRDGATTEPQHAK